MALDILAVHSFILPSYLQLERENATQDVIRCVEALDNEREHLDILAVDWASWDQTYRFIQDGNEEYIESCLGFTTLQNDQLNLMCFLNEQGRVVWGAALPRDAAELTDLTDRESAELFSNRLPNCATVNGLAHTQLGLMFIASRPILTSDGKGPARGSVVMGRLVDPQHARELEGQTRVHFHMWSLGSAALAPTERAANAELGKGSRFHLSTEGDALYAYARMRDIEGKPALLVRADLSRDIVLPGRHYGVYAVLSTLLAALIVLLVLAVLLQRVVLSPLSRLTRHIGVVRRNGDLAARLNVDREDEIGTLAREYNGMLDRLEHDAREREKAEAALREARDELETRVEERTAELAEANRVLQEQIAERIKAEEQLRVQAKALNAAGNGIVITDEHGHIVWVNDAYAEITGHESAEAHGQRLEFLGLAPEHEKELWATLLQGNPWTAEIAHSNGSRLLATTATAVRDTRERITHLVVMQHDISEQRHLEEQLRQSQKMEAIGRLAGGVAHDFNNLLTTITGYSQLLLADESLGAGERADVGEIERAAFRAAELTRQLLAFSRKQMLQPRLLELNVLVKNLEKMLRRLIGEDVELAIRLAPNLERVLADPGQIEQVIMNLAVNARDAMPDGGMLTIETESVYLDEEYARQRVEVKPGPHVCIHVSDNGAGMSKEVQARVFEPFFTTKEMGKGTGLGLSIVYGILKQSGGHVGVYSEIGHGTTFRVYLPVASGDAGPAELPRTAEVPLEGHETILLVEDETELRVLARRILEEKGYRVFDTGEPEEAVRRLEEGVEPPDLLLTDVVMPRMNGRELGDILAARYPGAKVLYMSGYTEDAIMRHGVLRDGTAFVQKPFTPETLLRRVRERLDTPNLT